MYSLYLIYVLGRIVFELILNQLSNSVEKLLNVIKIIP